MPFEKKNDFIYNGYMCQPLVAIVYSSKFVYVLLVLKIDKKWSIVHEKIGWI